MRKIFTRSQYYRDNFDPSDYQVGHLVPARLGGYGARANLTLQRTYINQSIIKIIEGAVAHCNDNGHIQSSGNEYAVAVGYSLGGDLTIPNSYHWSAKLRTKSSTVGNGKTLTFTGSISGNRTGNSSSYRNEVVLAASQLRAACTKKTRLPPPSVVNTIAQSAAAILITWSIVEEAEKYNVFIREGNNNYKYLTTTRNPSYTASGLRGGTNHSFIVTAIGPDNVQSVRSTISSARTFANTSVPLEPPQNVSARAISSSAVKLTWSNPGGAVKYNVFQKAKGSNYYNYKTTVSNQNSVIINGLSSDFHEFALTAIDGSGRQSARSSIAKANCTCVFY